MFNNLANYLFGVLNQEHQETSERVAPSRVTSVLEDDWVLVEHSRDSEGDTDISSSLESIPCALESPQFEPRTISVLLTRTSSTSSLPCAGIEDSWFLTPPPCFTSAGPVHMETSPLENLLIEHPSMSVYQHSVSATQQPALVTRRHNSAPSSQTVNGSAPVREVDVIQVAPVLERDRRRQEPPRALQPQRANRRAPVDTLLRQQERQGLNVKNAQKVQIHKACQSLKRGYFERNNKAREVNCRNHRQRRGERSQGSVRSNANNNRKCC